ncbi:permease [Sporolactobacillus shoreicorticis]|uniref:Permease n=1 Tax=Sporolactobacillus shoreicorticis TaxID=1923877 RepID=A0ABW5S0V7_9BACL|nr:permease [Sporolactobacillus shoreicorticis]MCO7127620.1 permease [Sporolactobacillus shoreicorticis]
MNTSAQKRISHPMTIIFFIFLFLLVFFSEKTNGIAPKQIPSQFYSFNTIFLSMVIESLPFILIGVVISVLIQAFVNEDFIHRIFSGRHLYAMIPAALAGVVFPVCECAIIPVIRSLIKKGLPQHIGVVMVASIPIINPIVFLSTFYAFQNNPVILYARMIIGFLAALFIGGAVYLLFRKQSILKGNTPARENGVISWQSFYEHAQDRHHHHEDEGPNKLHELLLHISGEFFDTAKFFIFGALIASSFQTFFNQHLLSSVGANPAIGPASMMGMAYLLSVCSTSDAFLASSFSGMFSPGAITAFLVFGAMLDIKNTMMLLGAFKFRFVIVFMLLSVATVYILCRIMDFLV